MTKKPTWCPLCGESGHPADPKVDLNPPQICCLGDSPVYHTFDPQEVIEKQDEIIDEAERVKLNMQEILDDMEEEEENSNMHTYYCEKCGTTREFNLEDIGYDEFPCVLQVICLNQNCFHDKGLRRDLEDAVHLNKNRLEYLDREIMKAMETRRKLGEYNE